MRKVTAWMTDDSKLFESQYEALTHERRLKLKSLLEEESVGRGGNWTQEMFLEFLLDNEVEITAIFNILNQPHTKESD